MIDDQIHHAIDALRARAQRVGPLHGYWDMIFDAEQLLAGQPTLLTREVILDMLEKEIVRFYEQFGALPVGAVFHRAADVHGQYWKKTTDSTAEDIPAVEEEQVAMDESVLVLALRLDT